MTGEGRGRGNEIQQNIQKWSEWALSQILYCIASVLHKTLFICVSICAKCITDNSILQSFPDASGERHFTPFLYLWGPVRKPKGTSRWNQWQWCLRIQPLSTIHDQSVSIHVCEKMNVVVKSNKFLQCNATVVRTSKSFLQHATHCCSVLYLQFIKTYPTKDLKEGRRLLSSQQYLQRIDL